MKATIFSFFDFVRGVTLSARFGKYYKHSFNIKKEPPKKKNRSQLFNDRLKYEKARNKS